MLIRHIPAFLRGYKTRPLRKGDRMNDFATLLTDTGLLRKALRSIDLSARERADLSQLYWSAKGVQVTRDKNNRVRGDTVHTCSKVGSRLTAVFDGVGPTDQMMWFATLKMDAKEQERWIMRPSIRLAIAPVLGFKNSP